VLIATPVYDYNVPASLKSWIDHIVRKGLTLGHDGKGLVTGKKATVLIASGGSYQEGSPIRDRDIAQPVPASCSGCHRHHRRDLRRRRRGQGSRSARSNDGGFRRKTEAGAGTGCGRAMTSLDGGGLA